MLILTRRIGESIVIGEDIQVTVLDVKGNQVRLGVQAPKTVSVDRPEIRERKNAGLAPPVKPVRPPPAIETLALPHHRGR